MRPVRGRDGRDEVSKQQLTRDESSASRRVYALDDDADPVQGKLVRDGDRRLVRLLAADYEPGVVVATNGTPALVRAVGILDEDLCFVVCTYDAEPLDRRVVHRVGAPPPGCCRVCWGRLDPILAGPPVRWRVYAFEFVGGMTMDFDTRAEADAYAASLPAIHHEYGPSAPVTITSFLSSGSHLACEADQ